MFTPFGKICIGLTIGAIILGVLVGLSGCTRLLDLDRHIWSPVTQTEEEEEQAHPPPLLEIVAGGLALFGFGGMANWVRRIKHKQEKMKSRLNNHTNSEEKKKS